MLQDDAGVLSEVRLDSSLVNSDTAVILLDEYNDTCWVWVGKNVNMPTRMHTLRMARAVQKSGHQVGVTTIGRSTSKFVEMMEKDAGDPEVAANINTFKEILSKPWKFEDEVLAYDEALAAQYEAAPVKIRDTAVSSAPSPPPAKTKSAPATRPPPPPPPPKTAPAAKARTAPAPSGGLAEHKIAYLLYAVVKNSDLVYTERFTRGGKLGIKIESPGTMVIEALLDGDELRINPPEFGDNADAKKIKTDYESWTAKL
ncbi:MAG: hypothetical protein K9W43_05310 [Candidatus Thorarchaeota archaeon]|nr:hypothetical protein [Candidatus Thorarchaeota archaeon]